jgi:tRNA threonylcarbamoyladenosine biosynthesis protein TsaB
METGGRASHPFALIELALREAKLDRAAIECIAVGLGPGSYTGIRAAIAVAQGWQLARDIRVLGIGSVNCLAAQARARNLQADHFLIDAQRGEFYCGTPEDNTAHPQVTLRLIGLEQARSLPVDALVVEPELAKTFPGAHVMVPDAGTLGQLAALGIQSNFVDASTLEPVYLRPVAFVKAPPSRDPDKT